MASFVIWPLVVLVALTGWGLICAVALRRIAKVDLGHAGELLAAGVSLFVALSGLAVALDRFASLFIAAFVAVGVSASSLIAIRWWLRARSRSPRWWTTPAVGATLIGAVLALALSTTSHFEWNPCDDDSAYLYLARRLLLEGDLLDPFNFRRLASLGGMSALQALFLVRLPDMFLPFADAFVGSLLILFSLWRTRSGGWALWGIAASPLVLLLPAALGPINTSPVFIPVGLVIAAFSVAVRLRAGSTTRRMELGLGGVLGLYTGCAAALRPQFGVPFALFALASVLWPRFDKGTLFRMGGLAVGWGASVTGWAIASWRAVGTPMFPISTGNASSAWLGEGPDAPAHSLVDVITRVFGTRAGWASVGAVTLGVTLLMWARRGADDELSTSRWGTRLLLAAAMVALVWTAIMVELWWELGEPWNFARLWSPIVVGVTFLPLLIVSWSRRPRAVVSRLGGAAGLGLVMLILLAWPSAIAESANEAVRGTGSGYVMDLLSRQRYASYRAPYDRLGTNIPDGSKVLAAVDLPSLLLGQGFVVHTLDQAGSTSPPPRFPYFSGTSAKISWLRRAGYDYVVAIDPAASGCLYNLKFKNVTTDSQRVFSRAWAAYYFDWSEFIEQLSRAKGARVAEVGPLVVLKV